jgi:DNA-directed RNA polymerase specialized sigma24 family protein
MSSNRDVWSLNSGAFDHLLRALDADRDRAALAYEEMRGRLSRLMYWWGGDHPEELADQTLDRLARKLAEGSVVAPGALAGFARGIARMVFLESRRRRMENDSIDEHPDLVAPPADEEIEAASSCLNRCLDTIAGSERGWIVRYYSADSGKIDLRRKIAQDLGINTNALRVRAHRMRDRLEACVTDCVKRSSISRT